MSVPTLNYSEAFSLKEYKALLIKIIEKNYDFTTYEKVSPSSRHVILRHDIDNSLEYALEVAKIEAELNIKSYFFVLLNTNFYNAFSFKNKQLLEQIISYGHYIGLHFDASPYCSPQDNVTKDILSELNKQAENECTLLENFLKVAINHISFHRPIQGLLNHEGKIAGRYSTYNELYFSKIGYCSDSGGEWKFGNPLDHTAIKNQTALQLLTHPIWWAQPGNSPNDKLKNFLARLHESNIIELKSNSKVFNP